MIALLKEVPALSLDSKGRIAFSSSANEASFSKRGTWMSRVASRKAAFASMSRLPCPRTAEIKAVVQARLEERKNALDRAADTDINSEGLPLTFASIKEAVQAMLKNAGKKLEEADAHTVLAYIQEQVENIKNPHRALELELARLVEAKTPPNGEFYKTRADKNEFTVAFFHRVYGRFYAAKVLRYKSQVHGMDADFAHLLGQYTQSIRLLTKREENDEALAKVGSFEEALRLASVAARRKKAAA